MRSSRGDGRVLPAVCNLFLYTRSGSPLAGTQTIAFGFTDGDGNNNTLTDFGFGGGAGVAGTDDCGGASGCSGDLASGISLNDAAFLQFFTQQFEPGASLSFILDTTNSFTGGVLVPSDFHRFWRERCAVARACRERRAGARIDDASCGRRVDRCPSPAVAQVRTCE